MDSDLEALKRQRGLVAQHLAWLDEEIARRHPRTSPEVSEFSADNDTAAAASGSATLVDEIPVHVSAASGASPHAGLEGRQQIGCVVLALLLAAGVIFVFWILPGWIYD